MSAPVKARVDVDEDVDDLDDVLQQFNQPPAKPAPTQPSTSAGAGAFVSSPSAKSPSAPSSDKAKTKAAPVADVDLSEDFARELTLGMESLMREIASEAGLDADAAKAKEAAGEETEEDKERARAFKAAWEAMLLEGMNGSLNPDDLAGAGLGSDAGKQTGKEQATSGSKDAKDSFQASIRKAMEKLKESDSSLQTDASSPESLEALLAQLKAEGGGGGGGEGVEDFQGLLEEMMTQLMSKEILYDPLKELHDKFPNYLTENASKISADDKKRYDSQHAVVTKIIAIFEDPTYSDDDPEKGVRVVELMNEMQGYGSPPAEIMGPLPAGIDLGPDGMPKLPEGCTMT